MYISDGGGDMCTEFFNVKLLENYTLGRGGKTILTQTLMEQTVTMGKAWINIMSHGEIWC